MSRIQRDETLLPVTGLSISNSSAVVTMNAASAGNTLGPKVGDGEGITTSTISKWLKVNDEGTIRFIPMWT